MLHRKNRKGIGAIVLKMIGKHNSGANFILRSVSAGEVEITTMVTH
jgi:hypothetical protein